MLALRVGKAANRTVSKIAAAPEDKATDKFSAILRGVIRFCASWVFQCQSCRGRGPLASLMARCTCILRTKTICLLDLQHDDGGF
ncbi:MAG: hypothetical protein U0Y68_11220 [Blastocatellia bacterium]